MPDTADAVTGSTTSEAEDLALLNAEEPAEESKEPEKESADEIEIKESDEPEKVEAKEEEEEEPEKTTQFPYDRPSMQDIKKEFPDIFKKFPSLRDVYYREQEFSQIFPTIEDAQTASTNAEAYNNLSDKVLNGKSEEFLSAVKDADGKAFTKLATSLLPSLYKISPDVHWQATAPLMQNLVRGFFIEGEKRQNDNIKNAAEYLADFIFGDIRYAHQGVKQQPEESEESKQLKKDREEFESQKYMSFFSSVKSGLDDQMLNAIDAKKVDPDKIFSQFIRDTIVGKVRSEVDKQLAADKAHMKYMASLWEKAKNEGYSDGWKSRIQSAYLARAKSLIPSIRARFVAEAQGSSARVAEHKKATLEKANSRREPTAGGKTSHEGNGQINPKRVDWSKTSDLDLLNGNVSYKR